MPNEGPEYVRLKSPAERWEYQKRMAAERVGRRQSEHEAALARAVNRDPCVGCAVPADRHDEYGCKQYIPRR